MARQELVAMILAGGQGSRLGVLTQYVAKPAVPYGSRYRIIDFPLSNCTNSGIEAVGVLTQYQPFRLNTYMGNGHSWDLDRNNGGLSILPPFQTSSGSDWYKGTANAIYQNIHFIDMYEPKYVLILSGDHIYKMNYLKMLKAHIENEADATIAVIEVPWEEASRFGIMNTDENGSIVEFEEKPAEPKSNLASMGIYIFSWDVLREKLIEDEANKKSDNDFGKNIIPAMLADKHKLQAYKFEGYWKDVGTIYSLWESNMDLLDHPELIDLSDPHWRIYSRNPIRPAHYIADNAKVVDSVLTDGDKIYGEVYHSVLSNNVVIEEGAVVKDSILMPGVVVGKGTHLDRCIVGIDTHIGSNVKATPQVEKGITDYVNTKLCSDGITVFQGGLIIKNNISIAPNSMISEPQKGKSNKAVVKMALTY